MTSPSLAVKRPTTGTGGDWPTGECWMTAGNPYKQHKVRATSPPPPPPPRWGWLVVFGILVHKHRCRFPSCVHQGKHVCNAIGTLLSVNIFVFLLDLRQVSCVH